MVWVIKELTFYLFLEKSLIFFSCKNSNLDGSQYDTDDEQLSEETPLTAENNGGIVPLVLHRIIYLSYCKNLRSHSLFKS